MLEGSEVPSVDRPAADTCETTKVQTMCKRLKSSLVRTPHQIDTGVAPQIPEEPRKEPCLSIQSKMSNHGLACVVDLPIVYGNHL